MQHPVKLLSYRRRSRGTRESLSVSGAIVLLSDSGKPAAVSWRSPPTTGAVEELQKVGFPQAMTLARLLADPGQRRELAGTALIVDEAGMIGSQDMAELIELAKTAGARIVYSGDTRQIANVYHSEAL
jgi:AAA domain